MHNFKGNFSEQSPGELCGRIFWVDFFLLYLLGKTSRKKSTQKSTAKSGNQNVGVSGPKVHTARIRHSPIQKPRKILLLKATSQQLTSRAWSKHDYYSTMSPLRTKTCTKIRKSQRGPKNVKKKSRKKPRMVIREPKMASLSLESLPRISKVIGV